MALELTKYFPKSEDEKLLLKEKYFGSTEVQTFGFVGENNISSDLGILLIAFAKLKLKIICNAVGKNPFGQTCRDHAASDYLRLNPLVLAGFPWGDHAGERSGLPG